MLTAIGLVVCLYIMFRVTLVMVDFHAPGGAYEGVGWSGMAWATASGVVVLLVSIYAILSLIAFSGQINELLRSLR